MNTSFRENLRRILDYRNVTIKELSFETGIPKRTLENYLNARASIPPADYACKIAQALDTSVEYLVNGSKPNKTTVIPPFSPDAIRLIHIYQALQKKDKTVVFRVAESLKKQ